MLDRIVKNVDVLVGNEEDLQKGLGLKGPDVHSTKQLDPTAQLIQDPFFLMMPEAWRVRAGMSK